MCHVDERSMRNMLSILRSRFGFGFACASHVSPDVELVLDWNYADGNTNDSYELIRLPESVGALGKVWELGRGIVVQCVDDDIPEGELFQYPIIMAEALKSFFAFPLFGTDGQIKVICLCGTRFVTTLDDELLGAVQRCAAENLGLFLCTQTPLEIHGKQEGFAYMELAKGMILAQEAERKRIARELHDGISQEILVAQMELRRMRYLPQDQWQDAVDKASDILRSSMSHLSSMAHSLRPAALDELGLAAAIRSACASSSEAFGIRIETNLDTEVSLAESAEIALYRILQEALSNACKYSGALLIAVDLRQENGAVSLIVKDDGCGFDTSNITVQGSGLGLQGMEERASLIGAFLSIQSQQNEGTTVSVQVEGGQK